MDSDGNEEARTYMEAMRILSPGTYLGESHVAHTPAAKLFA